jgi:general secretion pathway protein G
VRSPRKRTVFFVFFCAFIFLVGAAYVLYETSEAQYDARPVNAQSGLQTLQGQLNIYARLNGFHPTTEQGLNALVSRPTSSPIPQNWSQLVFPETLVDPWHHSFVYRSPSPKDSTSFDLFSLGPDGVESDDDLRFER